MNKDNKNNAQLVFGILGIVAAVINALPFLLSLPFTIIGMLTNPDVKEMFAEMRKKRAERKARRKEKREAKRKAKKPIIEKAKVEVVKN